MHRLGKALGISSGDRKFMMKLKSDKMRKSKIISKSTIAITAAKQSTQFPKKKVDSTKDTSSAKSVSKHIYMIPKKSDFIVDKNTHMVSGVTSNLSMQRSVANMNSIPAIRHIRVLIMITCFCSFMAAPCVFLPLGRIQASYDDNCFLYTDIRIVSYSINDEVESYPANHKNYKLSFDPSSAEWTDKERCQFITFTPVSALILVLFIAMFTMSTWVDIMANSNGSVLMFIYLAATTASTIACFLVSYNIHDGFSATCDKLAAQKGMIAREKKQPNVILLGQANRPLRNVTLSNLTITCTSNADKVLLVELNTNLAKLNDVMGFVETASWVLSAFQAILMHLSFFGFIILVMFVHYTSIDVIYSVSENSLRVEKMDIHQ